MRRPGSPLLFGLSLVTAVVVLGCGGSYGSTSSTSTDTKAEMRSVAVSGYQSQVAATRYILPMMVKTAPTGSPMAGLGGIVAPSSHRAATPGFIDELGLYYTTLTTGATVRINLFTDAAGTQSAGFLSATIEGATSFNTDYVRYPVVVDLTGNVTAGNLVASGNLKLTFTDKNASNTLTGSFNAPVKGIVAQLDMSLDPTGNVGGSITVVQNGLTTQVTHLAGDIVDGFTGDAVVMPGNMTGTATINLITGTFSCHLSDGKTIGDTTVSGGVLRTTYNDGTTLTLDNPVKQPVSGSGTGGSGGGGGGNTNPAFTFTALATKNIVVVTPNGKVLGLTDPGSGSLQYAATATGTPMNLPAAPGGLSGFQYAGMNSNGQIAGLALDSSNRWNLVYWSSPTATPIVVDTLTYGAAIPKAVLVLKDGKILWSGFGTAMGGANGTRVYTSPSDKSPYLLKGGYAKAGSDGTAVVGFSNVTGQDSWVYVWPNVSPTTVPIKVAGADTVHIKSAVVGPTGTVAVTDYGSNTSWLSHGPSYLDQVMVSAPTGYINPSVAAVGTNDKMVGSAWKFGSSTSDDNAGTYWSTPTQPTSLRGTAAPFLLEGQYLLSDGSIVGFGRSAASQLSNFVLTPK